MSVSLARNLSKQPGKRFENTIVISETRAASATGSCPVVVRRRLEWPGSGHWRRYVSRT